MAPSDDTILQFGSASFPPDQEVRRACPTCGRRFSGEAAFCPYDGERLGAAAVAAERGDPRVGITVDGRYEIRGVLGEGGMGIVYRVRHATLARDLALKAMRRDLASESDVARRFIQEAKAAASVSHPGVVEIIDFGTLTTGEPYFVMELLHGRSLGQVIREHGCISAVRATVILRQLAEALGAAHQAGVVHRDLKPENVVVGDGDQVKVLDFGLAKVPGGSKLTRNGVVFGTPHYMSPEQAAGDPVDHRSDIYALGVLAFQMVTGRVPFEADTYMGVMTQHMYMAPPLPSDFVAPSAGLGALEPIVMRCLAKDVAARFQSMEEVVAALDRIGASPAEEPRKSRKPSVMPRHQRGASTRNRGPILAVALVLAASIVSTIAVLWRLRQQPAVTLLEAESPPTATPQSSRAQAAATTSEPPGRHGTSSAIAATPGEALAAPVPSPGVEARGPSSTPAPTREAPAVAGEIIDPWKK